MRGLKKREGNGAADGARTRDFQNHNLALLPTELQPPQYDLSVAFPLSASTAFCSCAATHIAATATGIVPTSATTPIPALVTPSLITADRRGRGASLCL